MNRVHAPALFCAFCFKDSVVGGRCQDADCGRIAFDHTAHQSLPPGTVLRSYRIGHVLGSGSFGITYRAKHVSLNKFFVLKELFPDGLVARDRRDGVTVNGYEDTRRLSALLKAKAGFLQEANVLADIDGELHPEIVKINDFFEENGTAYIVMPFLEGWTLGARIEREGALDEDELLHYLRTVLRGLRIVHRAGICHQDLKPENIYLVGNRVPVLIDFGLAQTGGKQGHRLGTPGYASPEQGAGQVDQRSDIYALGATVYAALSSVAPTPAQDRQLGVQLNPDLAHLKTRLSPLLVEFMERALQLRPEDRYTSVDEIFTHLRPLLEPKQDWIKLLPEDRTRRSLEQVQQRLNAGKAYPLVWNWWPVLFSGLWFLNRRVLPAGAAALAIDALLIGATAWADDTWMIWLVLIVLHRVVLGLVGNWVLHRDLTKQIQALRGAGAGSADQIKRALAGRLAWNYGFVVSGLAAGPMLQVLLVMFVMWHMDASRAQLALDIQANRLMCKIQDKVVATGGAPTKAELGLAPDQIGGSAQDYELEGAHIVLKLKSPEPVAGKSVRLIYDPARRAHTRCENLDMPSRWVPDICKPGGVLPELQCG